MKPRELVQNLALALATTAVVLLAIEGAARLVEKRKPPRREVADYIWDWDDKMPGGFYVMTSDGVGWPPWEEFNGDGLRDRTRTLEKPEGWTRIAILGDSVTLGAELTPQEAYPQLLEARSAAEGRRAEVMNVALWGWSTRQQRIAWQRIARRYRPDQAVLAVCLNDIPELFNNLARPPRWLTELHERSSLVRLLVNAEGREIDSVERLFSEADSAPVSRAFASFFEELRLLRREVEADGASFALVVFPFRFQVEPEAPAPLVQERIAAFCRDEGLPCLDLLPTIAAVGPGAFIDYDHLSPSGAQLVADTLYASGLLKPSASEPETLAGALASEADPAASRAGEWAKRWRSPPGPEVLAVLSRILRDGDPSARQAAAWALGAAGPSAAPFVSVVAERLREDPSSGVRTASARALGAIGERAAVEALARALADASEVVRAAAARSLWRLGVTAAELPALAEALQSADSYVAAFAAWSLGNLGEAAEPATPALVSALRRDDTNAVVAGALARLGPAARSAVPELVRSLESPDYARRWRAARTLGRIGSAAEPAVGALAKALGDSNSVVRAHAARALGRIGPAARPAAAALQRATGDPEAGVRDEARRALEQLHGTRD